jgi:predicted HTH domain antitoxin
MVKISIYRILSDLEGDVRKAGVVSSLSAYIASLLYQKGFISIGRAAELSGKPLHQFQDYLAQNGIPISNLTFDQVMADAGKI